MSAEESRRKIEIATQLLLQAEGGEGAVEAPAGTAEEVVGLAVVVSAPLEDLGAM